jgi:predicted nucleic acid-binding protein
MATLLLDTTFLMDVLNDRRGRGRPDGATHPRTAYARCCPIDVAELYAGLRAPEAQKTETLLRQLAYVPIRWEAAKLASDLKRDWARKGKTLTLTDTTIAAVCLTESLTLLTDNRKHFPMPEISLYPLPPETA